MKNFLALVLSAIIGLVIISGFIFTSTQEANTNVIADVINNFQQDKEQAKPYAEKLNKQQPVVEANDKLELDKSIEANEVIQFTRNSISQVLSFSYNNYENEFILSSSYFTSSGWIEFENALKESGTLQAVIDNRFTSTVKLHSAPIIIAEGLLEGRYGWKMEVPVTVTYQSASNEIAQNLLVTAIVVRRPEVEHPKGLGIVQLINMSN